MTVEPVSEPYVFDIELSLARMSVSFAANHKDDPRVDGLIHQVRRLEKRYRDSKLQDRADKLLRILEWWDNGAPESTDKVVLSFEEQESLDIRKRRIEELLAELYPR